MNREHRIRITWSPEAERIGLSTATQGIDPVWLLGADPKDEGWSLSYRLDVAPSLQGNPSEAVAQFMMDDAPQHWLTPGNHLSLFERDTGKRALVEVLD